MGGSGGRGSYRLTMSDIGKIREEAQARLQRSRTDADVNAALQQELVQINDRNIALVGRRLDDIEAVIQGEVEEFDRVLFAGSVAKHTYVDGLSDIDALVLLSGQTIGDRSPTEVRLELRDMLAERLNMGDIETIEVGRMAVTVKYRDGLEIQLLPAGDRGEGPAISSSSGNEWVRINPAAFAARLTKVNATQAGGVVPAIKLAKAVIANQLPEESRPTGYHIESLAITAFETYDGPRTPSAMVQHFFEQAGQDVLRPIRDVTGQSRYVDEYLGEDGSGPRRALSRQFTQIARRMRRANSGAEWVALLHE